MKRELVGSLSYVIGIVLILGSFATIVDTFKRRCISLSSTSIWTCGTDDLAYKLVVWSLTFIIFYGVSRFSK